MTHNPLATLDGLARHLATNPLVISSPDPDNHDRAIALIEASGFAGVCVVIPDNGSDKGDAA